MTLTQTQIEQYHQTGYVVVPDFIPKPVLEAAQSVMNLDHPHGSTYFENPSAFPRYAKSQFSGIRKFPFGHLDLNCLVLCDAMVTAAQILLGADDIRFTKGEYWAKYSGAVDYEQSFHRDFGNHTLVVPRTDHRYKEVTTFIFLSDVAEDCGPTAVLPRHLTDDISFGARYLPDDPGFDPLEEQALALGKAGTVLFYSYDVFHRGTSITGKDRARFMVLGDFRRGDAPWIARQGWPEHGIDPQMIEFLTQASPVQRNLFDIPPPGHEYWNEQTLIDMAIRYPGIDLEPYRAN